MACPGLPSSLALTRTGRPDRLEVVQHEDWRLVPPQILHRVRDLAILDEERAVARQTSVETSTGRMYQSRVIFDDARPT